MSVFIFKKEVIQNENIIYKIFTVKLSITYIIPGLISRHPLNL